MRRILSRRLVLASLLRLATVDVYGWRSAMVTEQPPPFPLFPVC